MRASCASTPRAPKRSPACTRCFTALSRAAAAAASAQLRNVATLGGNLPQRPRCRYYRNPQVRCWLKGGDECPARDGENREHAIFGAGRCVAVHPSDPAAALLAFDAAVRVRGARNERTLPLDDLFALPEQSRRSETTLAADELLLEITMPLPAPGTRSTYLKTMDRGAFCFALVGVAAALRLSRQGRVDRARVVVAGLAPIPWRARSAEQLLAGSQPAEALLERAAEAAVAGAAALRHNAWKIPLARTLVLRALQALV